MTDLIMGRKSNKGDDEKSHKALEKLKYEVAKLEHRSFVQQQKKARVERSSTTRLNQNDSGPKDDFFEEKLQGAGSMNEIEALKKIFGRFLLQEQVS